MIGIIGFVHAEHRDAKIDLESNPPANLQE
jgi:hypothetical protein